MLMYYQLKNNHFSKNYSNCDIMLMILLDEFLPVHLQDTVGRRYSIEYVF